MGAIRWVVVAGLWGVAGSVWAQEVGPSRTQPRQEVSSSGAQAGQEKGPGRSQSGLASENPPATPRAGMDGFQSSATAGQTGAMSGGPGITKSSTAPAAPGGYDFGDFRSETLVSKAWKAVENGEYAAAEVYATKCVGLYEKQAVQQGATLKDFAPADKAASHWALNDVGTAYFILGRVHLAMGRLKEAQQAFNTVIERFPYAQCWDPKGWFWKVAEAASDKLSMVGTTYDFGDYTSQTLTGRAWEALKKNDYRGVELYTKKCIELYEAEAKKQQNQLTEFAPKEKAFDYWALNDVGTGYFILGESLMAQKRYKEARAAFERVVNDFGFSQCWDTQGWFWKVAVASRGRLNKILAESGG